MLKLVIVCTDGLSRHDMNGLSYQVHVMSALHDVGVLTARTKANGHTSVTLALHLPPSAVRHATLLQRIQVHALSKCF